MPPKLKPSEKDIVLRRWRGCWIKWIDPEGRPHKGLVAYVSDATNSLLAIEGPVMYRVGIELQSMEIVFS